MLKTAPRAPFFIAGTLFKSGGGTANFQPVSSSIPTRIALKNRD